MTTEIIQAVAAHYAGENLADRIYRAIGKASPTVRDLAPYDEFHVGGWRATGHLFARMEPRAGMRLLDIGSGLGGAARYCADLSGAHVTGIDLSPDYVDAATMLSFLTNQAESTEFREGNALALPFEKESFDGAYTIHAAMNIEDKAALYAGIRRVLKPGALFGIYDVTAAGSAKAPFYPVPWADSKETSFLATADEMQAWLVAAGFEIAESENRRDEGLDALWKMQAGDMPGPAMVMGGDYKKKVANLARNMEDNRVTLWQIIARATG